MKKILENKSIKIISIVLILLVIFAISSVRIVKSGEVGIRVRFGKASSHEISEGINIKIPFIEKIERLNIRVQKVEVTTNSSSKDLQDVDMSLAVNYQIEKKKAVSLYKTVGTGYNEVVLEPAIEEGIKAVTSQYTAEELITNRSEVSKKCREELDKKVSKYGLKINDFNITNFSFSKEFNKAIEEKQVAEQKVLTAKQELERERIEAEKKIVKAEAERQSNELKGQTLTDNIIREKFIEKWNGELPKVSGTNNMLDVSSILGE